MPIRSSSGAEELGVVGLTAFPDEGQVIAGRYALTKLIGRGGQSEVWEAYDRDLKRTVAVKLMYPTMSRDDREVLTQRLAREARAT